MSFFRLTVLVTLLMVLALACDFAGSFKVDQQTEEQKLIEPPTVSEIKRESERLDIGPVNLLSRYERDAERRIMEHFDELIDDAPSSHQERLEARRDRLLDRMHDKYADRKVRVRERLVDNDGPDGG